MIIFKMEGIKYSPAVRVMPMSINLFKELILVISSFILTSRDLNLS